MAQRISDEIPLLSNKPSLEENTDSCSQIAQSLFGHINTSSVPPSLQGRVIPVEPEHSNPFQSITTAQDQQALTLTQSERSLSELSLDEFTDKLHKFAMKEDNNSNEIAKELFETIPNTLTETEVVNLIFEQCSKESIVPALQAFLFVHPSFELSSYDLLRKAIVEDTEHKLNNSSIEQFFRESHIEPEEEKLTACYNLAYRLNHPYIYRVSQTPVLPSEYSLNFLWINLNPQDRSTDTAQNIFGNGLDSFENADCLKSLSAENEGLLQEENVENWEKIKRTFSYRIAKWAEVNPGAQINLWYDSALVTPQAQQKTAELFQSISVSNGVALRLKDIRQLPNISMEIGNSLHPGTPVYYRVDMLKALIADYMIGKEKNPKYCVVSDIDVQPMSPQQMFDQRTVDNLSSNGYVFNRVGIDDFENSFFIFNKENDKLKQTHYDTIIGKTEDNIRSNRFDSKKSLNSQSVFKEYMAFRREMEKSCDRLTEPRKVVRAPQSQFNTGGKFSERDHQAEQFRFISSSNVPFTLYGRNYDDQNIHKESPIKELRNWKAEPLPALKEAFTPLHRAVATGHLEAVDKLIQGKVDINTKSKEDGITPLFIAVEQGRIEVVEKLIQNGADVNIERTGDGATPLLIAIQYGYLDIVEKLLQGGADVKKTARGITPTFSAIKNGHINLARQLRGRGGVATAANREDGELFMKDPGRFFYKSPSLDSITNSG